MDGVIRMNVCDMIDTIYNRRSLSQTLAIANFPVDLLAVRDLTIVDCILISSSPIKKSNSIYFITHILRNS